MSQLTTLTPPATPMSAVAVNRSAGGPGNDRSLVEILWRRRRIIAAFTALALVVGGAYLLFAAPMYTAVSRLFIEAAGGKKAGQDAADRTAFLYTQREVLTSTPVLATALGVPGVLEFETFAKRPNAITALRNDLSVEVGKKDDLVTVTLDSPYPNEATQIVAAVVDAYARFQVTQRTAMTSETLKTLEAEKARTDSEFAERFKTLQAFSLEHRIDGAASLAGSAGSSDNDALRAIAASLTQAHLDVLAATARLPESAPDAKDDSAAAPETAYTAEDEAAVRQQLVVAENNLELLNSKYAPTYRLVTTAQARVEQLKRQRYAILRSIQRAAVKHEADLRAYYEAEQRQHIEQRAFSADYARMSGELARLQERADAIDTRLRDLKVNDENKMANVSVLDPAHADPLPTGPKKSKVLALALAAGLLLGLAAALAWDQFDSRLETAAEIDRWLGLTTLGVLPGMPAGGSAIGRALYTYSEPNSPFAFACRGVWASLNAMNRGAPLKTLAVASPTRGDGRTTAACGLAIAMAQHGRRVLLIDADVSSPGLAAMLGVNDASGLGELFAAPSVDAAALRLCVRESVVPNLTLLAGGRVDSVDRPNLSAVLDVAAREFDVVIVDTPAAHKNTDARAVAANCQATLLVVRLGHTDSFAAGRVRSDLYNVGANVLGVVLNSGHAGGRVPTVSAAGPAALAGPRDALGLPIEPAAQADPRPAGGLSVAS